MRVRDCALDRLPYMTGLHDIKHRVLLMIQLVDVVTLKQHENPLGESEATQHRISCDADSASRSPAI